MKDSSATDRLRLGTRGSALALTQARWVAGQLESAHPGLSVEILTVKTAADRSPHLSLKALGGDKALWVSDLEVMLQSGEVDLAVHSMKDVPSELAPGLCLGATPPRECSLDALVLPPGTAHVPADLSNPDRAGDPANSSDLMQWLDKLIPVGARIGTSSDRRQGQLLQWRPDLQISPARGNVDTRLRKLDSADWDALVLAAAGLRRLGLSHRITALFPPSCIVPAACQGVLALEVRNDDTRTQDIIGALDHAPTRLSITAERSFVRCAGGGCSVPLGAWARIAGANLELWFRAVAPGGSQTPAPIEHMQSAPMPENPYGDMRWAAELGEKAAARFLEMGGKAFLP